MACKKADKLLLLRTIHLSIRKEKQNKTNYSLGPISYYLKVCLIWSYPIKLLVCTRVDTEWGYRASGVSTSAGKF